MTVSMTTAFIIVGLTFTLSLLSVSLIRKYLQNQLLDIPNDRSSHTQPTPRGGGLGFIIAFAIAFSIAQSVIPDLTTGISPLLWLTLIPLIAIGILDDWRSLSSGVRYLVQFSVAVAVVYNCGPFPVPGLDQLGALGIWLAVGLTVIGVTALINFYNFMDGLDGLIAGVSAVQLGFLALWLYQPVLLLWVAALIGFLYWNWAPAKIFMGDAGSTTLGAIVSLSLLSSPQPDLSLSWTTLAILSPLVGDAVYTLCRRLWRRENIFKAHCSHLYQRLHKAGWSHAQVAGLYITLTWAIALGLAQFGASAAWITLAATPLAIAQAETYLSHPSQPEAYKTPQLANED